MAARTLQITLLRTMIRIRAFEERVRDLFAAGRLPGFVHLSIGQEAVRRGGVLRVAIRRLRPQHPPWSRAPGGEGRRYVEDDGRALCQADRLVQGEGRLHAHRRRVGRRAGCQRGGGRWADGGSRRRALDPTATERPGLSHLLRRRRGQSWAGTRGVEPGGRSGTCRSSSCARTTGGPRRPLIATPPRSPTWRCGRPGTV